MTFPDVRVNHPEGHARFVELCALYTSGALERDELEELDAHLAICPECRLSLAEYETLVKVAIPQLCESAGFEEARGFDREIRSGKARLLAALEHSNGVAKANGASRASTWRYLPFAALVVLSAGLCVGGYLFGMRGSRGAETTRRVLSEREAALRGQISVVTNERDVATQEHDKSQTLAEQQTRDLRAKTLETDRQLGEIGRLKQMLEHSNADRSQDASVIARLTAENASLKVDHETIARELQQGERNVAQLQQELAQLRTERVGLQAQGWDRDKKIEELTAQLSQEQRLLRADRDIRDLMGARDLLISDVIDVDTRGHNKKPFGRIFYTKNRSLIFYAFDLDRQPGLRNASAFQAWGARATSKGTENPVSMGIFYKDSATAERWVLKLDDPKVLEQIDSVFVTVEPAGGSDKPSGRQFLFAYLRGEANHP
jgi:hypothetical protein